MSEKTNKALEIKACRECGRAPVVKDLQPGFILFCDWCGISVKDENEPINAIENWNRMNRSDADIVMCAVTIITEKMAESVSRELYNELL